MAKELSQKQERFCQEYLITLNGTDSYKKAGYKPSSDNVAGVEAHKLLRNPKINARIVELKAIRSDKTGIDQVYVLKKLKEWLEADVTDFLDLSTEEVKELPKHIRQLIKEFKVTEDIVIQNDISTVMKKTIILKFVSKEKALDMIARHINFFEKDESGKVSIVLEQITGMTVK